MNEKIISQIMEIREGGRSNMLDLTTVQRIAFESGFYELVTFIEENCEEYFQFIMTGELPEEKGE